MDSVNGGGQQQPKQQQMVVVGHGQSVISVSVVSDDM